MGSSKDDSATACGGDNPEDDGAEANLNLFSDGERVLVNHGPLTYEAKVNKAEFRENEWRYLVHYQGWNKKYDEWVDEERIKKYTGEATLKKQAPDTEEVVENNPKPGRAKPRNSSGAKGKKQKGDPGREKDKLPAEKLIKIQIPSPLRKQLVDDCELITKQDKLVKLPRSPNVDEILTNYLDYWSKKDGMMTDVVGEIRDGLRCYFDRSLPVILLYKKERQQYKEAVGDGVSPSIIYGAEHLLRLFVKLPEVLAYANIEEATLLGLQQKLQDFLKFMQKNQDTFFLSTYDGSR